MANDPLTAVSTRKTPQSERARADQVKNHAGGYTFQLAGEDRLRRFLILGSEGGTYYQNERELTRENAQLVLAYAENDTRKLVDVAVEISLAGRAPKANPAIFALAAAASLGKTPEDRHYALTKVKDVCRTGTHLFLFVGYTQQFRGWGMGLRKAVRRWYNDKPAEWAALQAVKYRQRGGWSHRDLLRLSHPSPASSGHDALFSQVTQGETDKELPDIVTDFLDVQKATTAAQAVEVINRGHGVTWELLPTELLNEKEVWAALIEQGVPMTALIRQLPRLTNAGVVQDTGLRGKIIAQLGDEKAIRKARVHPVNVLIAMHTYAGGRSLMGKGSWTPDRKVIDALDGTFYKAFGNVEPTNKDTLIALDVSGSMSQNAGKTPLSCIQAEAAMSLVTMAVEPNVEVVGYTSRGWSPGSRRRSAWGLNDGIEKLAISPRQRLDDVVRKIMTYPMGGTDCSLPFQWAAAQNLKFDTVVSFTDNETWAGGQHAHQALDSYRNKIGVRTKSIVCGMTATDFSIADPNDPDSLDIVGLDSAVPQLIADFSRGF